MLGFNQTLTQQSNDILIVRLSDLYFGLFQKQFVISDLCLEQKLIKMVSRYQFKVTKERNPYFKRISANTPHKYSYDIETGRYILHSENAPDMQINKTGTLKPQYKHYFSGFANHKQRYKESLKQPAFMHYVPDLKYSRSKSFYTPLPDKFAGYTQYPYKLTKQFPEHLAKTGQFPRNAMTMRKCQSEHKKEIKTKKNASAILQNSVTTFMNQENQDKYFSMSFSSMTQSKPLPKKLKKTCYNYKCQHLKYFVFDEKGKFEESTKYSVNTFSNTLGRSFHQSSLKLQDQETKLIQQMS